METFGQAHAGQRERERAGLPFWRKKHFNTIFYVTKHLCRIALFARGYPIIIACKNIALTDHPPWIRPADQECLQKSHKGRPFQETNLVARGQPIRMIPTFCKKSCCSGLTVILAIVDMFWEKKMVGCVGWLEGQPAGKCQELLRKNVHHLIEKATKSVELRIFKKFKKLFL